MIKIEQCKCGYPNCSDYHLVGIGRFCQGSGFTKEDAQRIADLLNKSESGPDINPGEEDTEVESVPRGTPFVLEKKFASIKDLNDWLRCINVSIINIQRINENLSTHSHYLVFYNVS